MENNTEVAVFGGGCFWCTEAVFAELEGVVSVVPGYAGGHTENPTYYQVCTETTGHAEVSKLQFDPSQITYKDLLAVFFATHDPTPGTGLLSACIVYGIIAAGGNVLVKIRVVRRTLCRRPRRP